jgi:glycosyltransferase involved in cell wall biosynthesis
MRVLFVHDPPDLYGASRSLLRMASRLSADGHRVLVVLPEDGLLATRLRDSGVQVIAHPHLAVLKRKSARNLGGLAQLCWMFALSMVELFRLVGKFQPDLVHSNSAVVLPAGVVARIRGIPHVWHIREIFADFPKLWIFYRWYIAAFSDRIICVSQAVANQFSPRIRARKVVVLHDGVPVDEFPEVPAAKVQAFRHRYNLNGNLLVGLVGRIKIGRKGQDILLDAAARLKPRFPGTRFAFIGSPFPGNEDHLVRLQKLISEKNLEQEVIYTGDVDDVKTAYAAMDISVQSSVLPEAFSGVVVESMAMSKPVIATRGGGTAEQIEEGITGILVNPGDPEQLATALERLHLDASLRVQLGANGRKQFCERFEFEQFYGKLRTLHSTLIASQKLAATFRRTS